MKKSEIVAHWQGLTPNQQIPVTPVPYKHEGTTYGEDGIRITGSREFIDGVLSRLTDLLKYENGSTRLQVVYKQSEGRPGKPLHTDGWNCYVQVHERGPGARMANARYGFHA